MCRSSICALAGGRADGRAEGQRGEEVACGEEEILKRERRSQEWGQAEVALLSVSLSSGSW